MMQFSRWLLGCLVIGMGIAGCGGVAEDPATRSLRERYVAVDPLADPISLTDAASLLEANPEDKEPKSLVVVGRIYAGDLDPWEQGKASFVLSELPADGHGAGHDADNCPFCKRRAAKAPTGIVKFVDEKSETLSIDARKLFGIETGQVVRISGKMVAGELNSLVLIADKMQIVAR